MAMRNRLSAFFMRSNANGGGGNASSEPSEFEAKYARLLRARDTLKKVEATTKVYLKKARSLQKASKAVGLAMGTPDADVKRLGDEAGTALDDDTLIKAISAKVQLLDDTVKQRKKLDELKGIKDYHVQRLQQIKSKRAGGGPDDVKLHVEEAKWQAKLDFSQKEYDELLQEFTEALDFIDSQTKADGPWCLVGAELVMFRKSQASAFRDIEQMFVGAPAGTYKRDPAAEQAAIEAQKLLETAQLLDEGQPATPVSPSPGSPPVAVVATPEKDKKEETASHTSGARPKPPKPPGAESDDDDDDDDDII